jgi:hypothetical protein
MEMAKLVLEYIKALVWPAVAIGFGLAFKKQIGELIARVRHAKLPGGIDLDFPEVIAEAKRLSAKVEATPAEVPTERKRLPSIPLTEANARMIKLGLRPSPSGLDMGYYRALASQDPNLALAGLRIEIDILARNLAKGFNTQIQERDTGTRLLRKLYDSGAVTAEQMQLGIKVVQLCNAAVHGTPVSREEAESVIDIATVLSEQFLAWLSWGFGDGWTPPQKGSTPSAS